MKRLRVELSRIVTSPNNVTYLELTAGKGLELFDETHPSHNVLTHIRASAALTKVEPIVTIVFTDDEPGVYERSQPCRIWELYVADDADLDFERKLDILRVRNF